MTPPACATPWLLDDRHLVVRTIDPDAAYPDVSRTYAAAEWAFGRTPGAIDPLQLHNVSFGAFGLSTMAYGREVSVRTRGDAAALMVIAVVRGRVRFSRGAARIDGGPGCVVAIAVDDGQVMDYSADAVTCKFSFRRERVEALFARLEDGRAGGLEFALSAAPRSQFQQWLAYARMLAELAGEGAGTRAALAASLEEVLLTSLLASHAHSRTAAVEAPASRVSPAHVRRATAWIEANLADPVTLEGLADAAGCSMRSLHRGFREGLGTTPMRYLRERRLQRVRAALQDGAQAGETITQLALAHGFGHVGEFSALYREAFGELPRQTRRGA